MTGPAKFRLRTESGSSGPSTPNPFSAYATIKITPGAFPPDRAVLLPPNTNNVSVMMEQSTNLRDWTPATNGLYGGSDIARFFRIKMGHAPQ